MPQGSPHKPNDLSRQAIRNMSACGITQDEIAKYFGINAMTLRKHYREELDTALIEKKTKLMGQAFKRAMADDKPSDAVLIFLLKTLCGMRETGPVEEQGASDPIDINFNVGDAKGDIRVTRGKKRA
jgi:hypothetical protein